MTNEQTGEYDPMSVREEINEIYSSPEILEHARLLRSISQEATRRRFRTKPKMRMLTTVHVPELFGEYGRGTGGEPPTAPTEI